MATELRGISMSDSANKVVIEYPVWHFGHPISVEYRAREVDIGKMIEMNPFLQLIIEKDQNSSNSNGKSE